MEKTYGTADGVETTMFARAILGLGTGGGLGAAWAVVGRCTAGHCALVWSPWPATLAGAVLGLFVVLTSKWD